MIINLTIYVLFIYLYFLGINKYTLIKFLISAFIFILVLYLNAYKIVFTYFKILFSFRKKQNKENREFEE